MMLKEPAGWRHNILPKTQSRLASCAHKPCLFITSLLREKSTLLSWFLCLSLAVLVMSPSQSFTQQAHYLSLSRSPAAPTHSVTCMSPHDYLAHHHAQEIGTHYSCSAPPFLSAQASACVPLPAHSFHTLYAFSSFCQLSSVTEPVTKTCVPLAKGDSSRRQTLLHHGKTTWHQHGPSRTLL